MSRAAEIFRECVRAIQEGDLIEKEGKKDKEFHLQNWFGERLNRLGWNYDSPGRNIYPDFCLVEDAEGYEIKGLAYPGREANYDSNSQVPRGKHNGRNIFYVFCRYPAQPDGNRYPVLDLVICHGSFLNADSDYVHENKSFRGFGSYGDILVRDRKMYVVPTPFALLEGVAHRRTLILPADESLGYDLVKVGTLVRREAEKMVVAYKFDLRSNELEVVKIDNPNRGREHSFVAYRLRGDAGEAVILK